MIEKNGIDIFQYRYCLSRLSVPTYMLQTII